MSEQVTPVEIVQRKQSWGEILSDLLVAVARVALVTLVVWGVVLAWFPNVREVVTPLDIALVVIAFRALVSRRPPRIVG